ncbi:MAG: hypothetical protein OEV99_16790, partial [Nitrospira sp.]|nr:hypothetical protein [Nitrospira sp.]MDH5349028.1 hypothetical protein [Nitrospira sp.]
GVLVKEFGLSTPREQRTQEFFRSLLDQAMHPSVSLLGISVLIWYNSRPIVLGKRVTAGPR